MAKRTEEAHQMKVPAPVSFPRMLSLEQVQEILNLGSPAVYALVRSGELRAAQFGGRDIWRVREDDLAAYIAEAYAKTAQSIAAGQMLDGEAATDG
jgi:excisionase family DNA binding protein